MEQCERENRTGKSRMEPLGVLVFSVFMIASFLQVFIESVTRIMDPNLDLQPLGWIALSVMLATILIKGPLALLSSPYLPSNQADEQEESE